MSLIAYAGYDGPRRIIRVPQPKLVHLEIVKPKKPVVSRIGELNKLGLKVFADRGMPSLCRNILLDVAIKHRVDVVLLAQTSRSRIAVGARNEAMYLMKAKYPKLSMPQLGRWFDRDHTSILHSIASHQEKANLPHLVGYDLARARQRNAVISADRRSSMGKD